ncbi:hypothetical protein [Mycolicibacterium stellerae]|uniref:hypothetical protein n=1 Tax=Mycolicibacterium stellerae TaxID=2358193 RepID=UPI0013DDFF87|nr:hypothetical protein [Mycolicibacterium stellerae]
MTTSTALGRLLPATLLATGLTIAAAALGGLTAGAQPREWDIEVYDACVAQQNWHDAIANVQGLTYCCLKSGGVADTHGYCSAPPAEAVSSTPPTRSPAPKVPVAPQPAAPVG